MNRREWLAYVVGLVENLFNDDKGIERASTFMEKQGIAKKEHEGKSEEWFKQDRDSRVSEWLMGQLLDILTEKNNFFSLNSVLNIAHSFLEREYFHEH